MRLIFPLLLQVALLMPWQNADSQNLRLGIGSQVRPEPLDVTVLGFEKQSSNRDNFNLIIAAEIDVTSRLILGLAMRTRESRSFIRQIDPSGNDIGYSNPQFSEQPYYQTVFSSRRGYEIPISLRYRLIKASLMPYLSAEYSLGYLKDEGQAASYLVEERKQRISEVQLARVGARINSMTLGVGVEARVNSWFSFLVDFGWRHTFTALVDAEFMHAHETDVLAGKLLLQFGIFNNAVK